MPDRISEEITFRKLEVFLAYMKAGNLTRAAELLDTSTVSVHRALHSLQEGVRCQLFGVLVRRRDEQRDAGAGSGRADGGERLGRAGQAGHHG